MANPLKLPFDFPPNATPTTHQLQANFNALLQFVSDLNTAVISLSNLIVGTLQTTSTATIGGTLTAQAAAAITGALTASSTATVAGALTASSTATVAGALTAQSTAALNGAVTAGSTVAATGLVTANNGVTVNNAALTANSTSSLVGAVTAGNTVTATGLVTANNGATVNNAALTANSTTALNGAATAGSTLGVTGDLTAAATVKLANGAVGTPALRFTNSGSAGLYRVSADRIGIVTNSVKTWDTDSSGNITLPVQPAFLATITSAGAGSNTFGDGPAYTVPWDTEVLDRSSAFNMTTKTFTAAVDGVYAFVVFLDTSSVNVSPVTPTVTIVTSNQSYYNNLPAYTTATCRGLSVVYTFMDANDTCSATIAGNSLLGTKTADIDFGYFAGFLFG